MPIIIAPESINELSPWMRSGGWDKKSVAFACVVNNKTFKTEAVPINQIGCRLVNIIPKMTNHSELFNFLIVATSENTINGAGA